MRIRVGIFVSAIFIFSSCDLSLPELIEIQWKKEYSSIQDSVLEIIQADEVDIFPNCTKTNGVENHYIKIILRNPHSIPEDKSERQKISEEILLLVYPKIENLWSYMAIGVGFEIKSNLDGKEEFWSSTIETKNLGKLKR